MTDKTGHTERLAYPMSHTIEINPGHAANSEQVFAVTGYNADAKGHGKASSSDICAHYVVAHNEHAASQLVMDSFPNFILIGCINLKELKRYVVEMEAIRLGVKKPLGISESMAAAL